VWNNCSTIVLHRRILVFVTATIGFRPTEEDEQIIRAAMRSGERKSDVIRRALRLLEREVWVRQARADAERLRNEDIATEPDAW
jgi:Arc/MetJ-type ribon-helix-helix transcriptional regulator